MKKPHQKAILQTPSAEYGGLIGGIAELLEAARRNAARTVNALMTATLLGDRPAHCRIRAGRREDRAEYGEAFLQQLAAGLDIARFGRGFGRSNLFQIRAFYLAYRRDCPDTVWTIRREKKSDTVWTIAMLGPLTFSRHRQ